MSKKNKESSGTFLALGLCLGVTFGVLTDQLALGISFGLAGGVVIDSIIASKQKDQDR